MKRVSFIPHKGKPILFLDFSQGTPEDLLATMEEARKIIDRQPKESLLTLTYVLGARYNRGVIKALKEFTAQNRPFVRAAAVVGVKGIQLVILNAVTTFSKRKFTLFDDLDKAKDWLIEQ